MRLIDADALKTDLTRFYDGIVTAKQLIDEQPTIVANFAWKSISVKPEKKGEYLALWSLREKGNLMYEILNYSTFEVFDYKDIVKKLGWWKYDKEYGMTDFADNVRYWTELPDMPEVEE